MKSRLPLALLAAAIVLSSIPAFADLDAVRQFTLAKLLVEEGDYRKALDAFEKALALDPEDAYLKIEFADFMTRLGNFSRDRGQRQSRLEKAAELADASALSLPGNPDALRVQSEAYLALAELNPVNPAPLAVAIRALEGLREHAPWDARSLLTLGQLYQRQKRPADAADVFAQVLELAPNYQPLHGLLADSYLQSGQREKAVEPLRQVVAANPANEGPRVLLAEILSETGRHQEAVDLLRDLPPEVELGANGRRRLIAELYEIGDLDGALTELDAAPDEERGDLRRIRGIVLSTVGNNEDALAELQPILEAHPDDGDLGLLVSTLLLRQRRGDEAVALLERQLKSLETADQSRLANAVRLGLVDLYSFLREWSKVAESARALAEDETVDPSRRVPALRRLLEAQLELGRGTEAEAWLAELPQKPGYEVLRIEGLARLGRSGEAVAEAERLVASDDGSGTSALMAVRGLQQGDLYDSSIPLLESLPAEGRVLFELGAAYEKVGRRDDAIMTLTDLLESEPSFHPALNYLGYIWIEDGENLERALAMVEKALEADPYNGAYIDSLGWAYYRLGRLEEARTALERAANLAIDSTIYEHLGDTLLALGERQQARDAYRAAVDLEGDSRASLSRKLAELEDTRRE